MSRLQALRERRVALAKDMRQLSDKMTAEGYTHDAADDANWEKVNDDYNRATRAVEMEEKVSDVERSAFDANGRDDRWNPNDVRAKGGDGDSEIDLEQLRSVAFGSWAKARLGQRLTAAQEDAMRRIGLSANQDQLAFNLLETKDQSRLRARMDESRGSSRLREAREEFKGFQANLGNQSGTAGGFLVPPATLVQSLEINLLAYGDMFATSETITTSSGERMAWPTVDDTVNQGFQLGANTQSLITTPTTTPADPKFGQVYWDAYKWSSGIILVPTELLEDSIVSIPELLGELGGIRLGRAMNAAFTNGTGNNQPMGIVTKTSLGGGLPVPSFVTSIVSGTITADDIFNLYHQVDPAYRTGKLGFMMHDKILLVIRKLKDGDGQYLFNSGANYGKPDQLIGEQINNNQAMASAQTTGGFPILFGQLNKYKIRRVREMRVYHLRERYRDFDQDGFLFLVRADGNLLTAGTPPVAALKMS